MRLLLALAAAGAAYYFYNQRRRSPGSQTNASEAVDDIPLPRNPKTDDVLDAGVQETFPASDPVSVSGAGETEWERQQRRNRRS
jgi:hypothetical protein